MEVPVFLICVFEQFLQCRSTLNGSHLFLKYLVFIQLFCFFFFFPFAFLHLNWKCHKSKEKLKKKKEKRIFVPKTYKRSKKAFSNRKEDWSEEPQRVLILLSGQMIISTGSCMYLLIRWRKISKVFTLCLKNTVREKTVLPVMLLVLMFPVKGGASKQQKSPAGDCEGPSTLLSCLSFHRGLSIPPGTPQSIPILLPVQGTPRPAWRGGAGATNAFGNKAVLEDTSVESWFTFTEYPQLCQASFLGKFPLPGAP